MLLSFAFLIIAFAYASVGQAGASGYIAAMGVAGMSADSMKVVALSLNTVVAAIGSLQFASAGELRWRNIYPFALLGFPFSMLGGAVHLPTHYYYPVVGAILVLSGIQMSRTAIRVPSGPTNISAPNFVAALAVGAAVGFVSGMTGTGGGVFLAPIILTMGWASARETATTTAVYNLINSASALIGSASSWSAAPDALPWWLGIVAIGGFAGAYLGSRYLPERGLRLVLAALLLLSGLKLLLP